MLDCTAMNDLCLHFCDTSRPDLPLDTGVLALGRSATGLAPMASDGPWLLQLCNDRRGIWLTVAEGLRGIHVNGRPVLQLAMLRAGDSIHADGQELQLMAAGTASVPASATRRDDNGTLRLVLRGVGGPHHGRSLSLERPRRIGSAANADLRIEGHGISAEHARIEMTDGKPVLRDAAASVRLNGQPVQQALLKPGDQLLFGTQHRFVLEGSTTLATDSPCAQQSQRQQADAPPAPPSDRGWTARVPWLLVAALLMAAALSALLVFGAR
mgnify:CR=1 FL=1